MKIRHLVMMGERMCDPIHFQADKNTKLILLLFICRFQIFKTSIIVSGP